MLVDFAKMINQRTGRKNGKHVESFAKMKLRENYEYHFEILKAYYIQSKDTVQIAIRISDKENGCFDIILIQDDVYSSAFQEFLARAVYPTETGKVIEVNVDDFVEVSGWCEIELENGKPVIVLSTIVPELATVSSMAEYYKKN